jgi:hypothetical protein
MKVSTETDNNFGYEKITQLVDNIPLSTGTIDHDEIFLRNLLSEQVYVFFLLIKFAIVLQIRICGQVI